VPVGDVVVPCLRGFVTPTPDARLERRIPPNDLQPPRGPGRQHTVIQDQVDTRTRCKDRQAFQQFQRLEQLVRRAVRPPVPQLQHDLTRRRQVQTFFGDRRPQRIPAEPLKPLAMAGGCHHAGVQVKPLATRVATCCRGACARLIWGAPEAPDARAPTRSTRDPALH